MLEWFPGAPYHLYKRLSPSVHLLVTLKWKIAESVLNQLTTHFVHTRHFIHKNNHLCLSLIELGIGQIGPMIGPIGVGIGLIELGIGLIELGIGRTELWIGLTELKIGLIELGIGLIELGIGLIELGIDLIEIGIGLIELGTGLIELGTGLMELGIGLRIKNARRTVLVRISGLVKFWAVFALLLLPNRPRLDCRVSSRVCLRFHLFLFNFRNRL